ncbi:MAG: metallophosphoesterase family protein [Candidatus Anstonellaceae archaeon]
MKIAFVTDTHFGYRRFENDAYEQGKEAILSAARLADVLILGGDNFDTPTPRMETLAEVTKILREAREIFSKRGITSLPILAIHGNHDRRAKGFVHPTELMAHAGFLENIHNRTVVVERGNEKIAVSGMGSIPEDLASEAINQLACRPAIGIFNVFVFHQSLKEFGAMEESCLTFDDLPKGYDLYLCGHAHKPFLHGKVLNPGSTIVTQLRADETGPRGWLLYDTNEKKAEFRPIKAREFIYKTIKIESGATAEQTRTRIEEEIRKIVQASAGKRHPIVKIVIEGSLAAGSARLKLPQFGEDVFIENKIGSESLKEKLVRIKEAWEKKIGVREIGMRILRKKLEGTSYNLGDPERLFESLIEKTAFDEIKEKIEKT